MGNPSLNNEVLLILGMSRSGTSATAGAFHKLGMNLGPKFVSANHLNPTGYYEPDYLPRLNSEMRRVFGRGDEIDPRRYPSGWETNPGISPIRKQILDNLLRDFSGIPVWCLKFPTICRQLSFWLPLFKDLGVKVKILVVVRTPMEVAASMAVMHRTDAELALALWLRYTIPAVLETEDFTRSIILYEDLIQNGSSEIERIVSELNIPIPPIDGEKRKVLASFLSRDLRHHHESNAERPADPWFGWSQEVYSAIKEWRKTGKPNRKVFEDTLESVNSLEDMSIPYTQFIDYVKADADQVLSEYLSSYSMRITKPLRVLKRNFLKLTKKS